MKQIPPIKIIQHKDRKLSKNNKKQHKSHKITRIRLQPSIKNRQQLTDQQSDLASKAIKTLAQCQLTYQQEQKMWSKNDLFEDQQVPNSFKTQIRQKFQIRKKSNKILKEITDKQIKSHTYYYKQPNINKIKSIYTKNNEKSQKIIDKNIMNINQQEKQKNLISLSPKLKPQLKQRKNILCKSVTLCQLDLLKQTNLSLKKQRSSPTKTHYLRFQILHSFETNKQKHQQQQFDKNLNKCNVINYQFLTPSKIQNPIKNKLNIFITHKKKKKDLVYLKKSIKTNKFQQYSKKSCYFKMINESNKHEESKIFKNITQTQYYQLN